MSVGRSSEVLEAVGGRTIVGFVLLYSGSEELHNDG